ncbi:MAG: UDP-N-acetylmuramoyl-L-alanyl-D-glutamate--2,6-diaminopimelate ligase [Acidobacteriota bacterium]
MIIKELTKNIPGLHIRGSTEQKITGIAYSSQKIKPGFLFAALKGEKHDGFNFIPEAVEKGASAVLSQREKPEGLKKTWIKAQDPRLALALISAEFFVHPSKKMKVIGVTGTKGKTTVTYLMEKILQNGKYSPGIIGSISYRGPGFSIPAERTTPEAPDINALLQKMLEKGATHCIMEVSSHSLEMKRINGIDFDVTAFTNLSGEHLDYHQSIENYYNAKKNLFLTAHKSTPVINSDSPWGQKLISELSRPALSFGFNEKADVHPVQYGFSPDGIRARLESPDGKIEIASSLLGKPNLYNILTAVSSALSLKIPVPFIEKGITSLKGVPGRFEKVPNNLGIHLFVDYAHTDEALKNLLETAKDLTSHRIILVFGAGGDRDKSKRARMGKVAGKTAHWTIITSDNPRSEDPMDIISDIEKGIKNTGSHKYEILVDRRKAIQKALSMGNRGDYILIAGKGHEKVQVIKNKVIPFDDVQVARDEAYKTEINRND